MNEQAMNMCVEWGKGDVDVAQRQFIFFICQSILEISWNKVKKSNR